jgi:tetratricopeptide (TPR) repeat protein
MFQGQFLPNLLFFVAGQAAALVYLRTGRFWQGAVGTVLLWLFLDAWLVANYVFDSGGVWQWLPLLGIQLTAAVLVGTLGYAFWRRRWSADAKQRQQRFAHGLGAYLRGDYTLARATFTRLANVDPWDAAAWIALGDVLRRVGQGQKAKRCYRRAFAVDRGRAFGDLLRHHRPGATG